MFGGLEEESGKRMGANEFMIYDLGIMIYDCGFQDRAEGLKWGLRLRLRDRCFNCQCFQIVQFRIFAGELPWKLTLVRMGQFDKVFDEVSDKGGKVRGIQGKPWGVSVTVRIARGWLGGA
jgi:hypothetical protein